MMNEPKPNLNCDHVYAIVRVDRVSFFVSGRSNAAREGRIKCSHFEVNRFIAPGAAGVASEANESTQSECATIDSNTGCSRLVSPSHRSRAEAGPGHCAPTPGGRVGKCSHFDLRLG